MPNNPLRANDHTTGGEHHAVAHPRSIAHSLRVTNLGALPESPPNPPDVLRRGVKGLPVGTEPSHLHKSRIAHGDAA